MSYQCFSSEYMEEQMQISPLTRAIGMANQAGRKALIPYLPAGFPDKDRFWQQLQELSDCGADIMEIGIPFSDPVADGPTIEEASQHCLEQGVNLKWIIENLRQRRADYRSQIVFMGYCNPFQQYGWEKLALDAAQAGVSGIIVPDLPFEESGQIEPLLKEQNIDLIPLVGLNTSKERMQKYAQRSAGFVYFVSVMGTTGNNLMSREMLKHKLALAREIFTQPIALGFGLSSPEQLQGLEQYIDAAVFGSALIKHIGSGATCSNFMQRWI
jgi:tryptophan synthase alpha chain